MCCILKLQNVLNMGRKLAKHMPSRIYAFASAVSTLTFESHVEIHLLNTRSSEKNQPWSRHVTSHVLKTYFPQGQRAWMNMKDPFSQHWAVMLCNMWDTQPSGRAMAVGHSLQYAVSYRWLIPSATLSFSWGERAGVQRSHWSGK